MVTLTLDRLTAHYGRRQILSEITTPPLEGGRVVALLGPNAAGKSTLFRRILGLIGGGGSARIDGTTRERPLAYMPQDTGANAVLSVYESVLLARMQGRSLKVQDEDLAEVDRALRELGISELGERDIGDLSGGQRQLVGAAQALVQDPEILLLDEPTSALDLHRQIQLLSILQRLARERHMLILAALHDLGQALRFTDEAIMLENGRLIACGPTGEVVTPELLRRVYRVETRIEACSRGQPQLIVEAAT
ncbi:ABC transporter ATP-binding protein [Halomonas elongata]|uniref:ABC transporter ATP-binding protein n=1 Tax=Halomonas elongata (strain ATCC 33173 / DSM 2581 / NBRC 15536 / NCIMB 2198 / 1H9) TaxID=768066 RepID=E1VAU1_HALED|nr:ABC transporter ATP-binding protein [Halomonas elongata]MBW5801836.1 ABC transporter ATP-binding protein [Halomonas elongata]RAW08102.1 ABC transporter ATP-binding protein [Halomonas elongata]WBF17791.1 ABC transporter ATP-binding protein [Halomonas elongata]WPU46636.1 ABC transporter ATP-binding protein [Halomonas elongata DSM 2581]WVI71400.1 ABC transporter ATP-binding protein [Halomonas elongata]